MPPQKARLRASRETSGAGCGGKQSAGSSPSLMDDAEVLAYGSLPDVLASAEERARWSSASAGPNIADWPLAMLESMRSGRPNIADRSGGAWRAGG